jgi:hypothetical protein
LAVQSEQSEIIIPTEQGLTHYFNFEAMPSKQQEGEERSSALRGLVESTLVVEGEYFLYIPVFLMICIQIHASEFPTIAWMAWDYLAIPATSVSVE